MTSEGATAGEVQRASGAGRDRPLPLRPMTLGDILDGAFALLRTNIGPIVLVTVVFLGPPTLLAAYAQRDLFPGFLSVLTDPTAAESIGTSLGGNQYVSALTSIVSFVVLPFVAGAVARIVGESYLGRRVTVRDAVWPTLRRWAALLGSSILVHLAEWAVFGVGVALALVGAASDRVGLLAGGIGLLLLGAIVAVLVMPLFVATVPAVVLEEVGPVKGLRRSVAVIRPRYWPHLGIALLAGFLASVVASSVLIVPLVVSLVVGSAGWIVYGVGAILSNLVALPIVAIIATLQYFDGRIRHEGLDLELLADDLAQVRR